MKSFITLEEAIEVLDRNIEKLEIEKISLVEGITRRIAEDICANIDNPPFNKSAMDGYAIKVDASYEANKSLEVIDTVYAGHVSKKSITAGTAIKIMTGAMIPEGANAVIKQEDVNRINDFIVLNKTIKENENICFKGEDIKRGGVLIKKNKKINYGDLGILASAGINQINVYKKPKIALITTGDEVLDIDTKLTPGKIYNSNKYSLLGRVEELGLDVNYIEHEPDDLNEIGKRIKEATKCSDLVLTTGGVSVGEKDLINEAIKLIGGEILFWKVLIKPGSAVLCSKVNGSIVISLSGNPTAMLTTFELLVKSSLEKLAGEEKVNVKKEKATLINDFNKESNQRRFLRGMVINDENGQKVIITQVKSGNGILSSVINSNCLIDIPKGNNGIKSGNIVEVIKL